MRSFEKLGIDLKGKTSGQTKVKCPVCHESRKNKSDSSLSVNITAGLYDCHNCGFSGSVIEKKEYEPKVYQRPKSRGVDLSEKTVAWFMGRGISLESLVKLKVTQSEEFMPQVNEKRNCINFNYFRDGNLVNVKFRDGQKNFKMVSGAELIFYNLDSIKNNETVYVVEGEMDALTLVECGIDNVVSVPNGASKGNAALEYFTNCVSAFKKVKTIILATDTDEAGLALRDELSRRFGKHRCRYVEYGDEAKDFNDVLKSQGVEGVFEVIKNLYEYPLEGVLNWDDIEKEMDRIYEHGFPHCDTIGFKQFDEHFSFRVGEVTGITGIPNSGKSEFLNQVVSRLASRCGWRFGFFSFESQPSSLHATRISSQFIGRPYYKGDPSKKMSPAEQRYSKQFLRSHVTFVNLADLDCTTEGILEKSQEMVTHQGIKGIIIDPYNWIEHKRLSGETETDFISRIMSAIKRFAEAYMIHVFIVIHPIKMSKDKNTKKYEVPTLYNMSGSSNWFNKLDNGICVYRDDETDDVFIHIQKVKLFFVGKKGTIQFKYDPFTSRYAEIHEDFSQDYLQYFGLNRSEFASEEYYDARISSDIHAQEEQEGDPPF